jgi:hypothetical protein
MATRKARNEKMLKPGTVENNPVKADRTRTRRPNDLPLSSAAQKPNKSGTTVCGTSQGGVHRPRKCLSRLGTRSFPCGERPFVLSLNQYKRDGMTPIPGSCSMMAFSITAHLSGRAERSIEIWDASASPLRSLCHLAQTTIHQIDERPKHRSAAVSGLVGNNFRGATGVRRIEPPPSGVAP